LLGNALHADNKNTNSTGRTVATIFSFFTSLKNISFATCYCNLRPKSFYLAKTQFKEQNGLNTGFLALFNRKLKPSQLGLDK